ncbi:MAG: hypothetical protein QM796_17700 [Chthoniobacteraceae bacterium]
MTRKLRKKFSPWSGAGARVIIATTTLWNSDKKPIPTPTPSGTPTKDEKTATELKRNEGKAAQKAWGFAVEVGYHDDGAATTTQAGLPAKVSWHSRGYFRDLSSEWQPVYLDHKQPVLMERKLERGSLVVATDSYLFSNEAMRNERHTDLLAWLNGSGSRIIFDETHLGVAEEDGIATLIEKYRLYGVVGALALLAGLFAWRQASSLVPPHHEAALTAQVTGREASAGLVSLLRRSIPARELAALCVTEWRQTSGKQCPPALSQKIEATIVNTATHPVACYEAIRQLIESRKR